MFFEHHFGMICSWFGIDFPPPNPPKNGQKTRWNRSRTANPENQKNDTPPIVFASFLVPRGPEKHEKSRKIGPKMHTKIYGFFSSILKRFLVDFPPIWDPKSFKIATKTPCKIQAKNTLKNYAKNLDFGLQNGWVFWRFWLPKSTLGGALGPPRRPNRKSPPKLAKNHPSYEKIISKMTIKASQNVRETSSNK